MNYLVFLDACAGELEKILSGVKTMLVKEFDPAQTTAHPVQPGDNLYFLRGKDECDLQVTATVVRVLSCRAGLDEVLAIPLQELQPRLQLTEDQYNFWSAKKQLLLVEFDSACKIPVIHITWHKVTDQSDWIAFDELSQIREKEVEHEYKNRS